MALSTLRSRSVTRPTVRSIPLYDYTDLAPVERSDLTTAIQSLRTLADVLAWAPTRHPPRSVVEIVTQDEYTHDVVLPFGGDHFLAFDAT